MEITLVKLIRGILSIISLILVIVLFIFTYSVLLYSGTGEFSLKIGNICWNMNENYYSGLITIVVSIVAIALPLSISVITQSKDDQFNSKEMADSFYSERRYKAVKNSIFLLIILLGLSYFNSVSPFLVIPTTLATIIVLYHFYKFMDLVEGYVSDFHQMVITREHRDWDGIY